MREVYAEALAAVMKRMYQRGLIDVTGGNASIRVKLGGVDFVLITPGGAAKDVLKPEDMAVIDLEGNVVYGKPSSEYRLHLAVYREMPGASAIVHAHNPLATILAPHFPLETFMPEAIDTCITIVPHLPAGSVELARETASRMSRSGCRVAVLEKHGVVAVAEGEPLKALIRALDLVEAVENAAQRLVASMVAAAKGILSASSR